MLIDRSFTHVFSPDARTGTRKKTLVTRSPVEVTLAVGNQLFTASASDLTTRTVFVETARVLETGAHVAMAIDLPEGEVLARGIVRAIRDVGDSQTPGILIDLDLLASEDFSMLESFCAA